MIEGGAWAEQTKQQFKQFYIVKYWLTVKLVRPKHCWLRNLLLNKSNSASENDTNLQFNNYNKTTKGPEIGILISRKSVS